MTTPKWLSEESKTDKALGRPRLYTSPEEFENKCNEYFVQCDLTEEPYTVPGLSYFLGFASRTKFAQYGSEYPEFKHTVSRAKARIEAQRAGQLIKREGSTQGLQFDLKNNFGYVDRTEVKSEQSGEIKIVIETSIGEPDGSGLPGVKPGSDAESCTE